MWVTEGILVRGVINLLPFFIPSAPTLRGVAYATVTFNCDFVDVCHHKVTLKTGEIFSPPKN